MHTISLSEIHEILDAHTDRHSDLKMKGTMAAAEEPELCICHGFTRHTCTLHFISFTLTMYTHTTPLSSEARFSGPH